MFSFNFFSNTCNSFLIIFELFFKFHNYNGEEDDNNSC